MKPTLVPFIMLALLSFTPANNASFKMEDGNLIWQKVFQTDLTFDQLVSNLKDSGLYEKYDIEENKIQGEIKPFEVNYKAAGSNYMNTSIYISRNLFSGFVLIEYQPGKYRVTFKKIMLTQTVSDPFSRKGDKETLDYWIVKKSTGEIRPTFFNKDAAIIELTLNKLFSIKEKIQDKNW